MCATKVSKLSFNASLLWDIANAYVTDSFDEPLASRLRGYLRSRNVEGLCSLSLPDPEFNGQDFRHLRQLQSFFKKNAFFSKEDTCSQKAFDSFEASEKLCRISNRRLEHYYRHPGRIDSDVAFYLERAQQFIQTVLGDYGRFLDRIPDLVKMTGGATEDRPRRRALPYLKISRKVCAPTKAIPLVTSYCQFIGNNRPLRIRAVDTNRVEFVPKNYKTHRTIACEPTAAIPFQLAFDSYVKARLKRFGCDLSSQKQNQELARIGSITGEFATLDLEAASDTISYNAVAWLFPTDFFRFLDSLRSRRYRGVVGSGTYAKFSSMGNGTTFTIETLIFLSLVRAVGSSRGTTYGDDIIVETEYVEPLKKVLRFLGFRLNAAKSFTHGPFRESCGADWLGGILITPFYVRKLPASRAELCHFINGVARIALPFGNVWKILRVLAKGLPVVPLSEDTMAGIHVSYEYAQSQGLIVYRSHLGPYVPASKQFVEISETVSAPGVRSYLLWLLFGGRVSSGIRKRMDGSIVTIEPSCYTEWNTGRSSRKLRLAAVRPWSGNFYAMELWERFITERT